MLCRAALLGGVLLTPAATGSEFRSIDGSGSNIDNPQWGMAGIELQRLAPSAYEDDVSIARGGAPSSSLPSARAISNAVNAQVTPLANIATDWLWQWGQFVDHDLDLSPITTPGEAFDIAVPVGDTFFDPDGDGDKVIDFDRSLDSGTSIRREQINLLSSYLDGSQIYGSDLTRAGLLRDTGNDGKMKMEAGSNGEFNLSFNTSAQPNAGGTGPELYLSGDIRANEQIGLTAVHTLFSREHNRIADDLKSRLDDGETALLAERKAAISSADNDVSSEDDFIYQSARKLVGAQIQKITYEEFLPLLLGPDALTRYDGHKPLVDSGISNEFSTAAFRVGHTMLSPAILRIDEQGDVLDSIELRDAFFNPGEIDLNGVDSLLNGLAGKPAQAIDTFLVDDVRNFLFGRPGEGGFDLAALNIQRGRDHGLSSYNDTRVALQLDPVKDFLSLTAGDADLAAAFALVYNDIDDVDLWPGGLAEMHIAGAMVGDTFRTIIADQFTRIRDGDRFFYELEGKELALIDPEFDTHSLLSDLILRNTTIASIRDDVFRLGANTTVAAPAPLALFLAGLFIALMRRKLPHRGHDALRP